MGLTCAMRLVAISTLMSSNFKTTLPMITVERYCGFWRRIFAHLIDLVVLCVIYCGIGLATMMVLAGFGISVVAFNTSPLLLGSSGTITAIALAGLFVFSLFTSLVYFVVTLGSSKQATWGMRLMDIAIRNEACSKPVGKSKVLVRHFLFWLPSVSVPLMIVSLITNIITMVVTKRKQTYYDMLTKTVYVMNN